MAQGLPYDSDAGRAWAAAITTLLTGHAYATSARTAARVGPFAGYHENAEPMLNVLRMHQAEGISHRRGRRAARAAVRRPGVVGPGGRPGRGLRRAQLAASVLAPTGTIGLLMDCDTTGVEPDLGLVKTKKLVGGGTMSIVNQTVPRALAKLGYGATEVDEIVAYVNEHMSILGAPHLALEHLGVFACSMGDNTIHYSGHIRMMGAVQPFISGAISKTVNMPEDVTVEDVEQLHIDAWRLGIKAVAIYRDNCKVAQPLSTTKKEGAPLGGDDAPAGSEAEARDRKVAARIAELEAALVHERQRTADPLVVGAVRERLPRKRNSKTFSFRVADCEGYVTVGEYEDGRPGEVFIKVSKQGSTLAGIMDAFSIAVSMGLQHGVPLATFVRKFANMKFEPAGITDDAELRIATSLIDYIARRLALDYLSAADRAELGSSRRRSAPSPRCPAWRRWRRRRWAWWTTGRAREPPRVVRRGRRRPGRWRGRSSSMRPSATAAATPCSGPGRATSAAAAGRPAGARESAQCRVPRGVVRRLDAAHSADWAAEANQISVRVGDRAFPFAIVLVSRPVHVDPRLAPFRGDSVGILTMEVEGTVARHVISLGVGKVNRKIPITMGEGVGVVVEGHFESGTLEPGDRAGHVSHFEDRFKPRDDP